MNQAKLFQPLDDRTIDHLVPLIRETLDSMKLLQLASIQVNSPVLCRVLRDVAHEREGVAGRMQALLYARGHGPPDSGSLGATIEREGLRLITTFTGDDATLLARLADREEELRSAFSKARVKPLHRDAARLVRLEHDRLTRSASAVRRLSRAL